jgi:orotidine-5'-phosphate decarboxylase
MIKAAAEVNPEISITAVTVLTSISEESLREMGIPSTPQALATSLASSAVTSGARAIVCSPLEVPAIRSAVGSSPRIITPGVRPAGDALGDQSRVMTPKDAIAAGSDFLVIGRPITSLYSESLDAMSAKAKSILDSIA